MSIKFLGTRGKIEARTERHRMHSSLLVTFRRRRVMIDCGADWLEELRAVKPHAIVLTHAHPDHAWGLKNGAPCPVYAPQQTWDTLQDCVVEEPHVIPLRQSVVIEDVTFTAFPVEHSLRCPAVGYRVCVGGSEFFYSPDVVFIPDHEIALTGVPLYIGDGATVTRSMVRRQGDKLFGHAPVRTQLGWCEKAGVPEAIFTHCGTEIVTGDESKIAEQIRSLGEKRHVNARVAYDGLVLARAVQSTVRNACGGYRPAVL